MAKNDVCRGVVLLLSVNGCQIHYEIKHNSKSSKTPVLFLHGWGCDSGVFADIIEAIQENATLIAMDFPAHGQSEEPPEPWSVKDFALQVKQLMENFSIVKVHIIAHSFGARVAIYLASHNPEMIDKLLITGGAGIKRPVTTEDSKRKARYKCLKAITSFFMKVPPLKSPMRKVQKILIKRYGSVDYIKLSEKMRTTFIKIISEDLTSLLPQIIAPTLLIWGEKDEETPLWMGKTMEHEIKDSGLIVFDGRSHYAFLEESDRFILIVRQYFWGIEKR